MKITVPTDKTIQIECVNSAPVQKSDRILQVVEHPRDNEGKFASGGNSGGTAMQKVKIKKSDLDKLKVSKITGNKLEKYSGESLKDKAVDYYKKELQGKSVNNPNIGKIEFSHKGLGKYETSIRNDDRAKMVVALPDIVQSDIVVVENPKIKKDNIVKYYRTYYPVEIGGEKRIASALIEEHANGRLFYNLNDDASKYIEIENSGRPSNI
jgi:hypothetical protein